MFALFVICTWVTTLYSCYNFVLVLHENALVFSWSETHNFFYVYYKISFSEGCCHLCSHVGIKGFFISWNHKNTQWSQFCSLKLSSNQNDLFGHLDPRIYWMYMLSVVCVFTTFFKLFDVTLSWKYIIYWPSANQGIVTLSSWRTNNFHLTNGDY